MRRQILNLGWCLVLGIVIVMLASAQDKQPPEKLVVKQPVVLHTEIDAVGWAFNALIKYPVERQPFIRFVYLPPWADPEWIGVMDYAVNTACSQTRVLYRADRHAGGWLLAYDMSKYARDEELLNLMAVWDRLAIQDPYFHVPAVNVQFISCKTCEGGGKLRFSDGSIGPCHVCNGRGKVKGGSPNVALLAPHLQAAIARHATDEKKNERVDVLVTRMTASSGAIYRADWLLEMLLTSARGKYPEFRQIKFAKGESGLTPLEAHLKKRGFSVEASIKAGGEKGALMLISELHGKSRVILAVYGVASRTPLVSTYDFKDSRIRPDQQFIRNVVEFRGLADASEAFVPMPNGLLEYILSNSKGEFIRVAPSDVAIDHTKPDGHTKELEMGMSCVICHSPSDGYNLVRNDMELLLGADTDFFGDDFSFINRDGKKEVLSRAEIVDLVAGRFGERIDEPDGVLGRARRDYSRAVGRVTDYKTQADGPSVVARLGSKIKEIYHEYRYRRINAERVCLELGVRVPPGTGISVLRKLVPVQVAGSTEDVLVSLLRNGAVIKRADMEAIYGEMARRSIEHRKKIGDQDANKTKKDEAKVGCVVYHSGHLLAGGGDARSCRAVWPVWASAV